MKSVHMYNPINKPFTPVHCLMTTMPPHPPHPLWANCHQLSNRLNLLSPPPTSATTTTRRPSLPVCHQLSRTGFCSKSQAHTMVSLSQCSPATNKAWKLTTQTECHQCVGVLVDFYQTCPASHLETSPKHYTMTTTVLFSVLEQTHCVLVIGDSEWVTVALHSAFWISAKVVTEDSLDKLPHPHPTHLLTHHHWQVKK